MNLNYVKEQLAYHRERLKGRLVKFKDVPISKLSREDLETIFALRIEQQDIALGLPPADDPTLVK